MENENELENSQNLEELAIPETLDAEQQAAIEAIKEQNKQLFERAKKAEALAKELKAKEVEPVQSKESSVTPIDLEKLNLRMDGYSDDEVSFIMKNGGASAKSNEFVTAGIEALRTKKKKETESDEANPSISSKSPIFKKYSEEQIREMPLAELEKLVKTLPSK